HAVPHHVVARAELAISAGLLDPSSHPGTARNRVAIIALLGTIDAPDTVMPGAATWIEAGTIAGILAATRCSTPVRHARSPEVAGRQDGLRRRLLNDTLPFQSAREQGAIFGSMDSTDMDLRRHFYPHARVLLFALE
ncbi:MAG: type II toxin-antitoxin system VapC family toxin, partial [Acetobacteraceae bacterium]